MYPDEDVDVDERGEKEFPIPAIRVAIDSSSREYVQPEDSHIC